MRLDKLIYQEKWAFMFNTEAMILLVNIFFSPRLQPWLHQQKRKSLFGEGESHYIWIKDYENKHYFFLQNSMQWSIWRHLRNRAFMHGSEILMLRRIFNLVSLSFVYPPCCDNTQFFDILFQCKLCVYISMWPL